MNTRAFLNLSSFNFQPTIFRFILSFFYLSIILINSDVCFYNMAIFLLLVFWLVINKLQILKFVNEFYFLIVSLTFYDLMRYIPSNYFNKNVLIEKLYMFEINYFGIIHNSNIVSLNEYFISFNNKFIDILSGFFYVFWVVLPVFTVFLIKNDRTLIYKFKFLFLTSTIISFIIFYAFPSAPPWYYHKFGNIFILGTLGISNFDNFDNSIKMEFYQNLYKLNSNVFAAIPSIHVIYSLIPLIIMLKFNIKIALLYLVLFIGVVFTALYSFHHYFVDVIASFLVVIFSLFVYNFFRLNSIR